MAGLAIAPASGADAGCLQKLTTLHWVCPPSELAARRFSPVVTLTLSKAGLIASASEKAWHACVDCIICDRMPPCRVSACVHGGAADFLCERGEGGGGKRRIEQKSRLAPGFTGSWACDTHETGCFGSARPRANLEDVEGQLRDLPPEILVAAEGRPSISIAFLKSGFLAEISV